MASARAPAPPVASVAPVVPPAVVAPGGPAVPCTGADLAVSLGPTTVDGAVVVQDLIFQNVGAAPCVVQGFPSVVAVAGNEGEPVGEPALPLGERGDAVRLDPRAAATAPLRVRGRAAYDESECRPRPVRGLRVVPGGGSGGVFVPRADTACAGAPAEPAMRVGTTVAR